MRNKIWLLEKILGKNFSNEQLECFNKLKKKKWVSVRILSDE